MEIFPFLSKEFSLIWKTFLNPYRITRAIESRCIQELSWLEIRAQVLRFDSSSFFSSYLYQKCQPYFLSFFLDLVHFFTIYQWVINRYYLILLYRSQPVANKDISNHPDKKAKKRFERYFNWHHHTRSEKRNQQTVWTTYAHQVL